MFYCGAIQLERFLTLTVQLFMCIVTVGCTDKKPILVGKPSALLIDYIVQKYHTVPARMCMVGDRLDTDIAFGKINAVQCRLSSCFSFHSLSLSLSCEPLTQVSVTDCVQF